MEWDACWREPLSPNIVTYEVASYIQPAKNTMDQICMDLRLSPLVFGLSFLLFWDWINLQVSANSSIRSLGLASEKENQYIMQTSKHAKKKGESMCSNVKWLVGIDITLYTELQQVYCCVSRTARAQPIKV
jgi:hypothetical protein